ncbi:hypothetical protein CBR_g50408 [Chara braunii]|uniref:Uncharacterized protein n=1 Tax=Chara braunii TaxID=69332 RepID=A0A388M6R7_CHABU|nr:hypothetical protein CBR_g50408 [Chara braunii]|eukprot:GBG90230.1 hypothetical protein CBR_g50408 [Chara braunii]
MSFSVEQVTNERLMVPGGAISAIQQVQRPQLSPDLLRFAIVFSTTAIHVATEFRLTQDEATLVLAEVSVFLRVSPPGESHISVIVVFIGDITTLHPARHTEIFRQLRGWATNITTAWVRLLARSHDRLVTANDVDLQLRVSSTALESAVDAALSFRIREFDVSILDATKWAEWWHAYMALSFYLLEVVFHWAKPTDKSKEDEILDDEVELLIIQVWRTDKEGELLGILFREVRDGHLDSITDKSLMFLAQLLDDLPLEILSRSDERPGTGTLALNVGETSEETGEEKEEEGATEEEISEVDHLQYTKGEETLEEEESEVGSDDPDYHESEDTESEEASSGREEYEEGEGGSGELSGPAELRREEKEVVAQRRRAATEGKWPIEESEGPPPQLLQGDPMLNPELPQEEIERNGGATAEGSGSRRRRKSESPAQSSPRPSLRLRRDAGARASSPIIIPSSP